MEPFIRDLRHGARSLLKSPGLTAIAVLALTLGVGLTTTMFSIVYGALMRGLPFEGGERIVHISRTNPSRDTRRMSLTPHDFADYRDQQKSFEGLAAYSGMSMNVSGTERPERYRGVVVTANTFSLLRVRPVIGRDFTAADDAPGAPRVAILGQRAWRDRFGADPAVLGKAIRVNGEAATVIGVMPDRFAFPQVGEIWLPARIDFVKLARGEGQQVEAVGRLREGVTVDQASLELNGIAKRLAVEFPKTNEGVAAVVKPYTEAMLGEEVRLLLGTMLGAVSLVLLIACANVANLLLGRAVHRSKELGIRAALGASRAAVIRQLLAEALLLAAAGGALGAGLAYAGVAMFNRAIEGTFPPFWLDFKVDTPILLFVLALVLGSTFLSGFLPALQASRADVNEVLKDESRGSSGFKIGRVSRALVMLEIALSCGLLAPAGLMIMSVVNLRQLDLGFSQDLFTARIGLPEQQYPSDTARRRFYEQLEPSLAAVPGVTAAGLVSNLPASGSWRPRFAIDGVAYAKPEDHPRAARVIVTPGFFDVVGARAVEGRLVTAADRESTVPVAIVNQSFARKYFKDGESPVGRRIRVSEGGDTTARWMTVVGVVRDLYAGWVDNKEPAGFYVPFAQHPAGFMSVIASTRGAPSAITPQVRAAVGALDPDLPLFDVGTLRAEIASETWAFRVFGSLFMAFGFTALFLAAVGLYAVMAFSVRRRTREVGVRMALGARPGDVLRLIVRQGFVQIAIGMAFGLLLAYGLGRLLTSFLFGVTPHDPTVFAGVTFALVTAGLVACLLPARRASRVDPMVALRSD
jgi:putative ABC transport system permease protein